MFVPILTLLLECLQIKVSLTRVDVLIVTRLCTSYSSTFVEIEMMPFFGDRSPLPSVSIQTHVFFVLLSRFSTNFCQILIFYPVLSSHGIAQSIFETKLRGLYSKYWVF